MKKLLMYAVAIVVYSVVVVLMRHSDSEIPNWVFWVLSFLLILVLGWIRNIGKGDSKPSVKEDDRYYFYNDRCSFKLPKEEIKQDNVEKDGMKHTLMTDSLLMTILEIRPGMPSFPASIPTKSITVAGYPCLAAKTSPLIDDYNQYYINCKQFVVQVSMTKVSEEFLNTFRLEK